MNVPRETVFAALFAAVSGATVAGGTPAFAVASRRVRLPSDVSPAEQPALFQMEGDEAADQAQLYGATRWRLTAHLIIYARVGADPEEIPSQQLNALLDAVDAALQPSPPGSHQTLGGTVEHCYIDGKVVKDEGVLDQQAFAIVPVTIIVGS